MGTYSIHGGHNRIVQGANYGGRQEHVMDRQVKDAVISKLRALGHTAYDDTDDVGGSQSANLSNIVAKCNSHSVDLVVSIHLNAYNTTANGVEVLYYDQQALAAKVSKQLADDIGWYNRGAKQRTDLYVLAKTSAPAILLELGFIDNESDMTKWNVDKIANSIVKALTGQTVGSGGGNTGGGSGQMGVAHILGNNVNLRSGPGTGYGVLRQLGYGESYVVWAEKDGWLCLGGDQWIKYDVSYIRWDK